MKFSRAYSEHLFFERLGSTNEYLQELVKKKKLSEGTVVRTNYQTHGKGHGDNTWESEGGKNLLMSILLKPAGFDAMDQFQISKVISLSLVDLVKKYCTPVSIKWPNDILVGEKKIAGILIENTVLGDKISESIAGIGLNVNQEKFPVFIPDPTSLKKETGCHFDIPDLSHDLIGNIEKWYMKLLNKESGMIDKAYEDVLYGMEEVREFEENERRFRATIAGVGQGGQLKLKMPDGEIREFGFKEVAYRF